MNVLFLVSQYYEARKTSRCRFHQMAAVGRQTGVHLTVWGKGFPDYDDDAPLYDNIKRVFGATAFDLVHVYKPKDHQAVAACPILKSIDYNEAWNHRVTIKEVLQNDIRLVIFHHTNDLTALKTRWRFSKGRVLRYIPHCAERAIFEPAAMPWQDRTVSVLLSGALRSRFYPLRRRCAQLIRAGQLPGEIREHPGKRTAGADETREQFVDYAQHLGRTRVALVLGITFDYALAKYPEAAMAGCLLVGEIPRELYATLGRYMVGLESDMPDAQIIQEVCWWVEHDDEAQALAAASQQLALSAFTMERYAEQFIRAARDCLDQERRRRRVPLAMHRGGRLRWTMKTWLGEQFHTLAGQAHGVSGALMSDGCRSDIMPDSVALRSASQIAAQSPEHWRAGG
jgi:hypothetical protein